MAIDNTDKALSIAKQLSDLSKRIIEVIEDARAVKNEKEGLGIDLTDFDNLFADGQFRHLDGNTLNNIISSFIALDTWATTNFHTTNWQQGRP
jgi:hypothetical protein